MSASPRRRTTLVIAVTVVVAILVAGAMTGPDLARRVEHRRNVTAYQSYVRQYVAGWGDSNDPDGPQRDQAWVDAHPDLVLAAGDRACDWLSRTPRAPDLDPTGHFSESTLESTYLGVADSPDSSEPYDAPGRDIGVSLSPAGRGTVVAGAWTNLCWHTLDTHTAFESKEED